MKFREDKDCDKDYVLMFNTEGDEITLLIPNHMFCKHCGNRVKSGIIGRSEHRFSCEKFPKSPLVEAIKEIYGI